MAHRSLARRALVASCETVHELGLYGLYFLGSESFEQDLKKAIVCLLSLQIREDFCFALLPLMHAQMLLMSWMAQVVADPC